MIVLGSVASILVFLSIVKCFTIHTKSNNPHLELKHPHRSVRDSVKSVRNSVHYMGNSVRHSVNHVGTSVRHSMSSFRHSFRRSNSSNNDAYKIKSHDETELEKLNVKPSPAIGFEDISRSEDIRYEHEQDPLDKPPPIGFENV